MPDIQVVNFGDNSIDLIIYFRADNSNWLVIKSDVMTSIYKNLNEEGIEIPLPQRDLHIKSVDEEVMSEISKKETGKKE
ncbi:MAG: hypothetical protein R3A12_09010 [Ignavibacteria bacterium]|nr:hypothetical protein [Ignavibacteriota bacterium]